MIDVSLKVFEMIETDRPYKPIEIRCCLALSSASEGCGKKRPKNTAHIEKEIVALCTNLAVSNDSL